MPAGQVHPKRKEDKADTNRLFNPTHPAPVKKILIDTCAAQYALATNGNAI